MVLHIGADATVPLERVLFILNARSIQPATRAHIERAVREHRYTPCTGAPKAFVVVEERGREAVHASSIAPATLEQRAREAGVKFPVSRR